MLFYFLLNIAHDKNAQQKHFNYCSWTCGSHVQSGFRRQLWAGFEVDVLIACSLQHSLTLCVLHLFHSSINLNRTVTDSSGTLAGSRTPRKDLCFPNHLRGLTCHLNCCWKKIKTKKLLYFFIPSRVFFFFSSFAYEEENLWLLH